MDITQCLNCLNRVLPSASMVCPSCRQRVDQPSESMTGKALVELSADEKLPRICIGCGEKTKRQAKVSYPGKDAEVNKSINILSTISLLFFGVGVYRKTEIAARKIPVCKRCNPGNEYSPRYLDQDTHSIKVVADKDFVMELNSVRKSCEQ